MTKKEKLEFAANLLLQNQKDNVVKMFRRHRSSQSLKLPQNEDIMKSSESSQVYDLQVDYLNMPKARNLSLSIYSDDLSEDKEESKDDNV